MRLFSSRDILLLLIGLLIISFFIFRFTDTEENPMGIGSDSYEFWHLSTNLLKNKEFAYTDLKYYPLFDLKGIPPLELSNRPLPCTARVPGYPFVLATLRSIWDSPKAAIVLNFFSYIGICLYGFLLGRILLANEKHRLIYNILIVFSPLYLIRWGIGADYLASLALTGFTFHLCKIFFDDSSMKAHTLWASLWGVLAVFTRANLLIFTITLCLLCFLWGFYKKHPRVSRAALVILLTIALGIGLWVGRNKKLTDQWTFSTQSGFVLYAVHLSYDINETHPLYYWFKQGRRDLLTENLNAGKTFNQSEAIINEKVKSVVMSYLQENLSLLPAKITNCLRTFFLSSYYDISDVLIYSLRPFQDRMFYLQEEHYVSRNSVENIARQALFQASRIYKIILAFSFFSFLFVLFFKNMHSRSIEVDFINILYVTTFIAVLMTAFFTGAGGDRLRMPFNVLMIIFAVSGWITLLSQKPNNKRSAS